MDLEKYKLEDGIYFPKNFDPNDFNYSDGDDFERELFDFINSSQDKSLFSYELIKAIKNWPSFCHLSPVRTNLLRPVSEILKGRILEMGAGCGIITRYLGETGGEVVALEASLQRARIIRARTADLQNVNVVCDRIETFNTSNKFDIVTMIGVLQYSRLFTKLGKNAELKILQAAIEQLSADGILIVAIQNKLGLKYFSGYPEANTGIPFFGIENHYHDKSIIRFDRQEIQSILNSLGLRYQKILYPFPDYHMPKTILSEKGIQQLTASSISDIIISSAHQEKIRPDWVTPHFMLESAWETICAAGLTSHLANAFLILASKSDNLLNTLDKSSTLGWHYSTDRSAEYAVEKTFQQNDSGEMIVKRNKICDKENNSALISHILSEEPYIKGRMYWTFFIAIVKNKNWELWQVAQWALKWMQFVCNEANIPELYKVNLNTQMVNGKLYDCTPFNCVQNENDHLIFIDKEWELQFEIKLIVILVRGLISSFTNITKITFSEKQENGIIGIIISLFNELNIDISEELVKEAIAFDTFCQKIIHDNTNFISTTNGKQKIVDTFFQLYRKDEDCQFLNNEINITKQKYQILCDQNITLSKQNITLNDHNSLLKNTIEQLNNEHEKSINNWQTAYQDLLNSRSIRFVRALKKMLPFLKTPQTHNEVA